MRQAGRVPVLEPPLALADRRALRTAVVIASADRRRRFPPTVQIGVPGGPTTAVVDDQAWDHGLRTDIVGAALRARGDPRWVWVTRSGTLGLEDVDAAWLGPTVAAAAERGAEVCFVVVTRHGWTDPRSGARQEWQRIRRP
jgi:hypothetical protein